MCLTDLVVARVKEIQAHGNSGTIWVDFKINNRVYVCACGGPALCNSS